MKNRLFAWLLAAILPMLSISATPVTVNVSTPGTLWETLDEMGVAADTVTSLKVTGSLNAADYQVFRKIMKQLHTLDLSEMSIMSFPADGSFENMTSLVSVKLPATITQFNSSTFRNCSNLVRLSFGDDVAVDSVVVFPASLRDIGYNTFESCYGFKSIDLSQSTSFDWIHSSAFRSTNIESAIMPSDGYSLENYCFYDTKIRTLEVDEYCENIGCNVWSNLRKILVRKSSPINASQCTFDAVNKDSCVLFVPIGSRRQYMLMDGWDQLTQIQEYGIQVKIGANGSLLYNNNELANNEIIFNDEQEAVFTIQPNAGFEVASATVDNQPVVITNNQIVIPAGTVGATIRVAFRQKTLSLNVVYVGDGLVSLNGGLIGSGFSSTYLGGTRLAFHLTPDAGNDIQSITCNGVEKALVNGGYDFIIDGIDENTSLVFTFANASAIGNTHTLTYTQVGNGSVSYSDAILASGSSVRVNEGAPITLQFASRGDFSLSQVLFNGQDITSQVSGNQLTLSGLSADGNLEVHFTSPTNLALTLAGGDLYEQLQAMGADLNSITALRLSGTLLASDITVMKSAMPMLATIDMSATTGLTTLPSNAFRQKTSLVEVVLPASVTTIESNAFRECPNLVRVTGCENVQYIREGAFYQCRKLTTAPWGDNLIVIDYSEVFRECSSLPETLIFPASLQHIENYAFSHCTSVKEVDLSACNQLTRIGHECFGACSQLTTVLLPNSANFYIEHYVWQNTQLSSISLPAGITGIGEQVFPTTMRVINCQSAYPCSVSSNTFNLVSPSLCKLNVPVGASLNYRMSNGWSSFTQISEAGLAFSIGENGKVLYENSEVGDGSVVFHNAQEVVFTLVPETGYAATKAMLGNAELPIIDNTVTVPAGTIAGELTITFTQKQLNIAVTTTGNGQVIYNKRVLPASANLDVAGGNHLEFTLAPDSGNVIKSITYNGEQVILTNTDKYMSPAIDDNATIVFEFASLSSLGNTSVVSFAQQGEGAVTYQGSLLTDGAQLRVNNGENLTLHFAASGDFVLQKLEVNGTDVTSAIANNQYTLQNIQEAKSVRTTFYSPTHLILTLTGGDLYEQLSALGVQLTAVKALTLRGTISPTDFSVIKGAMSGLEDVNLSQCTGLSAIPANAFQNKYSLKTVVLPQTITRIKEYAFENCTTLVSIRGCENVQYIEGQAFQYCRALKTLPFGDKLAEFNGSFQFYGCQNLPSTIVFPASLQNLSYHAFAECSSLVSVDLSHCTSLTTTDGYTFARCENLTNVILPKNTSFSLEYNAFEADNLLTSITIPAGVNRIGGNVFPSSITVINVESSTPLANIASEAFNRVDRTACVLNVPAGSLNAYRVAPVWSEFLNIQESGIKVEYDALLGTVTNAGNVLPNGGLIFHNAEATEFVISPVVGYVIQKATLNYQDMPVVDNKVVVPAGVVSGLLQITFAQKSLKLFSSVVGNGVVALGETVLASTDSVAVAGGEQLTFTLTPQSGYVVKSITFNGENTMLVNGGLSYTTPAFDVNSNVVFEFVPASELANTSVLTVNMMGEGVVYYQGVALTDGGQVRINNGENIALTFTPDGDFTLDSVAVNGVNATFNLVNGVYTINNVQADVTVDVRYLSPTKLELHLNGGDLYSQMLERGIVLNNVSSLKLSGSVAASDFSVIKNVLPMLEYVDMSATAIAEIPEGAFSDKSRLKTVILPTTLKVIHNSAFASCGALVSVTGCENVERIESQSFIYCHNLMTLPWGNHIKEFVCQSMYGCSSLPAKIVLPASVEYIGWGTFDQCTSIQEVDLSACANLREISGEAFYHTTLLTKVTLPTEPQFAIRERAFANSGITSFFLPENVTYLGDHQFSDNLQVLNVEYTTPISIDNTAFDWMNLATCVLNVPAGSSLLYHTMLPWSKFTNITESGIKISHNINGVVYQDGMKLKEGSVFFHNMQATAFLPIPNPGYEVGSVIFRKQAVTPNAEGFYVVGEGVESDTLLVNFVLKKFAVQVNTSGAGHVMYADSALNASATLMVDSSAVAVLSLVPDAGNMVRSVSFNGQNALVQNAGAAYATPAICAPASIAIEFAAASELTDMGLVNFNIGANGSVEFLNSTLLSQTSFYLPNGSDAAFTIKPAAGYTVDSLLVDGVSMKDSLVNGVLSIHNIGSSSIFVNFQLNPVASVHLDEPGYLSRIIPAEQQEVITHLTITGYLSEADFYALRDGFPALEALDIYGTTNTYIPYQAFCTNADWDNELGKRTLKSVRLPQHVERVEHYAFAGCINLEHVNFEELSVLNYIGSRTFVRANFERVDLSITKLTELGDRMFYKNKSLTEISFPNTLVRLGSEALQETSVERVDLSACKNLIDLSNSAFYRCEELSEVILPNSLKTIGSNALSYCPKLTHITIPASVESIQGWAFAESKFKTIDLSATQLTRVSDYLFINSDSLLSVQLPASVLEIANQAFYSCDRLEDVNLQELTKLTSIGESAFGWCGRLTSVIFPNSLQTIGNYAFSGNPIHGRLSLPASVSTIGNEAFSGSDFSIVHAHATVPPTLRERVFNEHVAVAFVPDGCSEAYRSAPGWEDLNILSGEIHAEVTVTQPGNLAVDIMEQDSVAPGLVTHLKVHGAINQTDFAVMRSNMTVLYDLDLSDADVSMIPERAFLDKTVLMHVKLPENLLMIEAEAFRGCSSLSDTLVLPSTLKTVGAYAFYGCKNISYLQMDSALEVIRNGAFQGCSSLAQELTMPAELTSLGEYAFADCYNLYGQVTFNPEFYMFIGSEGFHSESGYTFQNCSKITRVDMTACEYLYELPHGIFQGCQSLQSAYLPPYTERIQSYAFADCRSLRDIIFPNSLILINYGAFENCQSLELLPLAKCFELGQIMDYAFRGCTSLRSVNLPSSINYLGSRCFEDCRSLENLYVEAREPADLGEYVFRKVNTADCILSIPTLSFNDYLTAAQWGAFVQMRKAISVTLDEGADLSYSRGDGMIHGPRGVRARVPGVSEEQRGDANIKDGTSLYVQDQEVITFYIDPEENVAVRQVLFNNEDVTSQLNNNTFQTPNVTNSSTFTVLLDVTGPINAREIVLNKSDIAIKVAESESLEAIIYPNNTTDKTIFWTVDDSSIATVGNDGVVTGVAPGVTTLTATTQDGGLVAQCQVTIMSNDYYFLMDTTNTFIDNTVNVPVRMFNTGAATGFQCDVYLPEGLTMYDNGGNFGVQLTGRSNGHIVSAARRADGSVRVIAYSRDGYNFNGTDDILFYLPVSTLDSTGVYQVQLKNIHISGPQFFDFVAPNITTQIRVADYPIGDSNGDGDVTVSDVTTTVNHLLEWYVPKFVRKSADVNSDNTITVADVSATVDIIIERPSGVVSHAPRRERMIDNTTDHFAIADFEITPGETKTLNVELVNTKAYTAFQCDIVLPEGLRVLTDENGQPVASLSSRKTATHVLSAAEVSNGALRLVAISMQNANFTDAESTLFSITVVADNSVAGSAQIDIRDIRLVANNGTEEYLAPEATASVTYITEAPSSLDYIEAGVHAPVKAFSNGHQLFVDSPIAQSVMLVSADGKTCSLDLSAGRNSFFISQSGVYLIDRQKVIIW